jgi:hypothetical protein
VNPTPPSEGIDIRYPINNNAITIESVVRHFHATGFTIANAQIAAPWARNWAVHAIVTEQIPRDHIIAQAIAYDTPPNPNQTIGNQHRHQQQVDDVTLPYGGPDGEPSAENASAGAASTVGLQNQSLPPLQPPTSSNQLPNSEVNNMGLPASQTLPPLPLSFGSVGPLLSGANSSAQIQEPPEEDVPMEPTV